MNATTESNFYLIGLRMKAATKSLEVTQELIDQVEAALAEKSPTPPTETRESGSTGGVLVCKCHLSWLDRYPGQGHQARCPMYKAEAGSESPAPQPTMASPITAGLWDAVELTGHPIPPLPRAPGLESEATSTHVALCFGCQARMEAWSQWYRMHAPCSWEPPMIDLSESANELVCGAPAHTCRSASKSGSSE